MEPVGSRILNFLSSLANDMSFIMSTGTFPANNHIHCYNRIFDEDFIVDHLFVFSWGQNKLFDNLSMVLIDIPFVLAHPKVLPDNSRQELLNRYSKFS
jgi:hypothetical protein